MMLGQGEAEVWLNFLTEGADELSDVISRHPPGTWPDDEPIEERPPGWQGSVVEERGPTAEVPYLYEVGPLGWHLWQWYALGAGVLAVVLASNGGGGRRRR